MVTSGTNKFLILGAVSSAIAALARLGCIILGGDWYRFLGAGEQMASLADNGDWYPSMVTSVIVLVLTLWALYGLSGAKVIPKQILELTIQNVRLFSGNIGIITTNARPRIT